MTRTFTLPLSLLLFLSVNASAEDLIFSPAAKAGISSSTGSWRVEEGRRVVCNFPSGNDHRPAQYGESAFLIDQHGHVVRKLDKTMPSSALTLFEGGRSPDATNEFSLTKKGTGLQKRVTECRSRCGIHLKGYSVDPSKVKRNPQSGPFVDSATLPHGESLIAVNAFALTRDYDTESPDSPEGLASTEWNVFSIQAIPRSAIPTPNETLFAYQYTKSREDIKTKTAINRFFRKMRVTYPHASLPGVFINKKVAFRIPGLGEFPDLHGLLDWKGGNEFRECEWHSCLAKPGAQVIAYDSGVYGIALWSKLTVNQANPDETVVFLLSDGDGGPDHDDIMGLFEIPLGLLNSGERIIYRKVNSACGIDFVIELQKIDLARQ